MLIQWVPAKTERGQRPARACQAMVLYLQPFGGRNPTVVGSAVSHSWAFGYWGQPLQSAGDRPVEEAPVPGSGPPMNARRALQERAGLLQDRRAEFIEGKALLSHVPPLHFWDRSQKCERLHNHRLERSGASRSAESISVAQWRLVPAAHSEMHPFPDGQVGTSGIGQRPLRSGRGAT